ncbi:NADH dehydrogenase [ubiquinone] 1 alpha subcomplex subunit 7-like [Pseudomyrmex gracilis]|uniref:NADH dehydrogenase [ubiquinone] 1 alpha subcomplex subunit 7-like n=1 Tax=Pseudomyrmex gracilis TaxID=219809 RepID=UPI000995B41E|nr:NADH dehydrogenase [ubiquinone] 1 alpha subcomplex subunit 7-like [Pseudomyrmex gracilis]
MPGPERRSVTPLINFLRDLGRGRKIIQAIRFPNEQAARTQPPPDIPGGPYHKTSEIYYFERDARREVQPPLIISGSKQIGAESAKLEGKEITPAKPYNWDG